jgi:GNAT superfamily N-acetyltransferase
MSTHPDPRASFAIQRARAEELAELGALFASALAAYRGTEADAVLDAYLHDLQDGARSRWETAETYVAVLRDSIVGSVTFYPDVALEGWSNLPAGWAGFRALAVHPATRGAGVGRALVEQCLSRGREVGAPVVGIHTADLLGEAVRLYERLGFVRCAEYDLPATEAFPVDGAPDVTAIAFRFDLT